MDYRYQHGFPISYGHGSELTDEQALKNLTKLGKIAAPILTSFVIGWSLQTLSAMAVETPDTPQNNEACPVNPDKPTETSIAPSPPNKPIYDHIIPPAQCLEQSKVFQAIGVLSLAWVCIAAIRLSSDSLQFACIALAKYAFGFEKNSPNN